MKCIVVYYSLTGVTKRVAERLAGDLNCELEEVRETKPRKGFFGFMKSGYEAMRKKLPPILEPRKDPAEFEAVVFGTPVWAGTMASPMRTFLSRHGHKVNKAAFFCTAGGSAGRTFREMEAVLGRTGIAELALVKTGAKSGNVFETQWVNRINDFAASLKSQVGEKPSKKRITRAPARPVSAASRRKLKTSAAKEKKTGRKAAARTSGSKGRTARSGSKKSASAAGRAPGRKKTRKRSGR
jgi:flavodoxin